MSDSNNIEINKMNPQYQGKSDLKPESPWYRHYAVWLISLLTLASGLLNILPLLFHRFHESGQPYSWLPFWVFNWGRSATLIIGFSLVYLSFHLFRRRLAAWWLTVIASMLSLILHVLRIHPIFSAAGPLLTLVWLLFLRKQFSVKSEPATIYRGLIFSLLILGLAIVYGTTGFFLLEKRDLGVELGFWQSLQMAIRELLYIGNPDTPALTMYAKWFLESLNVLGLASLILIGFSLVQPLRYRFRILPLEREEARTILEQYGKSALDYFKIWHDKSYYFSPDRKCFIAYRAAVGIAISLGDPVGPPEGIAETVKGFSEYCHNNGWSIAFHQVLPDNIGMYRNMGYQVFKVGEEAVVDLSRFTSQTNNQKWFRYIRRRFESGGFRVEYLTPPHKPETLQEVEQVSRQWLTLPGRRERGFTLGRFEHAYIASCGLYVLREADGRIIAFANEIPSYRKDEATIDLMRHRLDIPSGAMDYLFMALMSQLNERKYQKFNLGLAPMAGVGEKPGDSTQERIVKLIFDNLNRLFSYKGLRAYKNKFEPEWEERFMVYQSGPVGLLHSALALIRITEGAHHE
jgi:phosphatidylglycerol lysyltransferase